LLTLESFDVWNFVWSELPASQPNMKAGNTEAKTYPVPFY